MPMLDLDTFHPIAMIDNKFTFVPAEAEGMGGFEVRRLYLGFRWEPLSWVAGTASINGFGGEHGPTVLDAGIRVHPKGIISFNIGYGKTPLFISAHDISVETLPVPELSIVARSFWPGRATGAEVHLEGPDLPVEAWFRLGSIPELAMDGRVDLVLKAGLRAGVGIHLSHTEDHPGLSGENPTGFSFWRAPTVSGKMQTVEGHVQGGMGPVQLTFEGAFASEGRSEDTDGNPETPRVSLDALQSWGASGEVAWMVTGQKRISGPWPVVGDKIGIEVAGRAERLSLGQGAVDTVAGGATGGELAVHLWHPAGWGSAISGGWLQYDVAPIEEPGVTHSWFVAANATLRLL